TFNSFWDKLSTHLETPKAPAVESKRREERREMSGPSMGAPFTATHDGPTRAEDHQEYAPRALATNAEDLTLQAATAHR
ncbi:Hypothetical predicted protein, partial [Pelobates cultripes]